MKKLHNKFVRKSLITLADLFAIPIAWYGAYWLRFNLGSIPKTEFLHATYLLPLLMVTQFFGFILFKLYRGIWSFASMPDLLRILKAVAFGVMLTLVGIFFISFKIPRSIIPIYSLLLVGLLCGSRVSYRWFKNYLRIGLKTGKKTLIAGAGSAADLLLRELIKNPDYNIVVMADDKQAGYEMHGVRIRGNLDKIPKLIERYEIELVIIAMPSVDSSVIRKVVGYCKEAAIESQTMPVLSDLVSGNATVDSLREISVEDLLGRDQVKLDWQGISTIIKGQKIFITGGGGSIGSELCRQVSALSPNELVIVDNSEFNLYSIDKELREKFSKVNLSSQLIDIVDFVALNKLVEKHKPDIIFHAAAYKHVPLVENQARSAVRNNILGTYNVANAAAYNNVKNFVLVSTDKAVNPANIMGTTKRVAEIICQSFNGKVNTNFITVRFGNVLGSTGSVIPLFKQQLAKGEDLTVTHPEITRYFMTTLEATQLILQATFLSKNGEIFVLDMGEPIKIKDLAEQMIYLSGKKLGEDIKVSYIGLRAGEKLYEELFYKYEDLMKTSHVKIRQANYKVHEWKEVAMYVSKLEKMCLSCDSEEKFKKILSEIVPEYQTKDKILV
ncbi:MAG: polysaccharide biosynthesis protein [Rickettsiales bacterium]|nr:polysaccharide biosynthesis protein [Rickettsiales bacterium]